LARRFGVPRRCSLSIQIEQAEEGDYGSILALHTISIASFYILLNFFQRFDV
jgi:hypothetical protein